ncbi:MAG: M13 family metallopeptidase [Flavobacteriaceae bacterium]
MKITAIKTPLIAASIALAMISCGDNTKKNQKDTSTEADELPHGIILKNMDTTVSPKDDFYNYVNGNWVKNTKIPDDQTRWGGFGVLRKKTDADMLAILDNADKSGKYSADTDQAKAMMIFKSELDTDARNKAGIEPLKPALEKIKGIKTLEDFLDVMSKNTISISQPFFGIAAFSNPSNSAMNSAYLFPGGLGLPERDYYLKTDSASVKTREQYVTHITRMLQFLGDSEKNAHSQAKTILAFETRLAEPRLDKVASRDFRNFNNPRSISQLKEMVPAIDLNSGLENMGVSKKIDTMIVMQPAYMNVVHTIFTEGDIATLKIVMRWATLNNSAGMLTTEIEEANWDFYSKTLNGAKKQKPANERALATVNTTVGEALGKLYVDEMFPPEAKDKAEKMVTNVIDAYKNRINALDWMSPETKVKAIEKLDKFTVKIGYPNKWKDYSTLNVKEGNTYYDNMIAVGEWGLKDNLNKIDEPVDRTEWGMSPQTVNAYFQPFNNEIVFPAAILQPPFYDYKADDAVNYGGIGAVIGHEISHAFDDSGSRFDANGNLVNWWTDDDLKNFTERGDQLAAQYSAVEVLPGVFIDGKFTLGENIGDLGGVLGAYDGLQNFYKESGRPEDIDGFTAEQRFFMSWATVWRTLQREESLKTQVKTNVHSPGKWRATQPLVNVDAFYKAFDIKEGDGMFVPVKDRVRIW